MYWLWESDRVIHGVKTALACLIGFVLAKIHYFSANPWTIITIVVVMCGQLNVGGVLQKAYMRFLGTLAGTCIALLTLQCIGNHDLVIALCLVFTSFAFSYIATGENLFSEAGTLGAVTVIIILVSPHPTWSNAIERFTEISIGIIIAALISQFVLPIHAREYLRLLQARSINKLRAYYLATLHAEVSANTYKSDVPLEEEVVQALIKQRKLAKESVRELLGEAFNLFTFKQILQSEKEILRSITAMHYAYKASPHLKTILSNNPLCNAFEYAVAEVLEKIAEGIRNKSLDKKSITLPDIEPLKNVIFAAAEKLPQEEALYLYAFLFAAQHMDLQLREFIKQA